MDQRRAIIAVAIVILLILIIIGGTIFYLARVFNSGHQTTNNSRVVTSSSTPVPTTSNGATSLPSTNNGTTNTPGNTALKAYQGQNFQLQYPAGWGLLTCTNSNNFEFDPYNSQDTRIVCDRSVKPITVLVNKSPCVGGDVIKINGVTATKVVDRSPGEIDYEWCTQTNPPLDITERVSAGGSRATAPGDFSIQVEKMIGSFNNASGGS